MEDPPTASPVFPTLPAVDARRRTSRTILASWCAGSGPAFRGFLYIICLLFPLQAAADSKESVLMTVRQVLLDPTNNTPVVVLAGAGKLLPIWIGSAEASSIARALEGQPMSRPNTHDLIRNLLEALGAKPERVTITELRDSTYFAVITVRRGRRRISIDSRPSDAIAVALRTGAPIYTTREVLRRGAQLEDPARQRREGVTRIMGMHLQDLTAELGELFSAESGEGVLIAHVETGSPASAHGFRRGDVIVRVNGRRVRNTHELKEILRTRPRKRRLTVRIQRDGGPVTIVMSPPS